MLRRTTHPQFHNLSATAFHRSGTTFRSVFIGEKEWKANPVQSKRLASMIARQKDPNVALEMFLNSHPHDCTTYLAIVLRLSRARAFQPMDSLLSRLTNSHLPCAETLFAAAIRGYGLASRPLSALRTFLSMDALAVPRSARSLNTLLNALVQNKRYHLFHSVFINCKHKFNVAPDLFTCNILIKALCKRNHVEEAARVLDEMPALGAVPNVVTYTTILGGFVARGDMESAKKVFRDILDRGWRPDATTYTILVNGFCRLGMLVDAIKVMDDMEENGVSPNEVTYGIMVQSYCKARMGGEALNLFDDMLERNYIPSLTLSCKVIDVLCAVGKVEDAHGLWKKLLKKNTVPDNAITSTLIHWLLKKGRILEAREVFDEFSRVCLPNVLTYNTIIGGMCEKGELFEAKRVWEEMVERECACNAFTCNMLIKGFCKAGNAKGGTEVLKVMLNKGCFPDKLTYSLLINSLSNSEMEVELSKVILVAMSSEGADKNAWDTFLSKVVLDTGVGVHYKMLFDKATCK